MSTQEHAPVGGRVVTAPFIILLVIVVERIYRGCGFHLLFGHGPAILGRGFYPRRGHGNRQRRTG